jgi:hypothetical protein
LFWSVFIALFIGSKARAIFSLLIHLVGLALSTSTAFSILALVDSSIIEFPRIVFRYDVAVRSVKYHSKFPTYHSHCIAERIQNNSNCRPVRASTVANGHVKKILQAVLRP